MNVDVLMPAFAPAMEKGNVVSWQKREGECVRVGEVLAEKVDPSRLNMDRTIDTLGPHTVTLNLHKDVTVELRVRVDKEGQEEG